jgi:Nickel responsive protein SCO4226-like
MAQFLVELYVSRTDPEAVDRRSRRARSSAETLTSEGTPVRFLRSIFVPEDETCFLLYEAGSADVVQEAARRADLCFERIAPAVTESNSKGETHA